MIWGFTGTDRGMTSHQLSAVGVHLQVSGELHHGDCVGADAQTHAIARRLGGLWIVGHPPDVDVKRAFCDFDVALPPRPYIDRNHDIVDACDFLLATPRGYVEELRSGTWATIRYARKIGTALRIIYPNGTTGV